MVVPAAILERELDFRARAKGDVGAALVQVAVSLTLAFAGLGVWSLVIGALAVAAAQGASCSIHHREYGEGAVMTPIWVTIRETRS
jgi:hypothetical protein